MQLVLRYMLVTLAVWLLMTGVCPAKQVYLKDGGIIECESFWRRSEQVMVKVNRDVLLDFSENEVDVKRTFRAAKKAHHRQPQRHHKIVSIGPSVAQAAVPENPVPALGEPKQAVAPVNPAPAAAQPQEAKLAKVAASKVSPQAASAPAAPPTPAPAVAVQPEVNPAPAESSAPNDKAEQERKMREASEMMAEAIKKQDPELLKKAMAAQKNAVPQEQQAKSAGAAIRILLILILFSLLIIVAMWVVFQKAGQPGWHSIIPIYNMYVLMEISGKPWWWMLLLFVPVVGLIIYLLAMLSLAQRFGRSFVYGLGLFFLPMFFFPMLAFGGAQYEG